MNDKKKSLYIFGEIILIIGIFCFAFILGATEKIIDGAGKNDYLIHLFMSVILIILGIYYKAIHKIKWKIKRK